MTSFIPLPWSWDGAASASLASSDGYMRMVQARGGVAAAIHLVTTPDPSQGFLDLATEHRQDLTIEHLVVQPKYASLFEPAIIDAARQLLKDSGFNIV